MKNKREVLVKLFLSTLYLSAFTFGGGYVIITLMKKKFVDDYHWIEENEMLDLVAIAQSAPGPIAVNGAIVVGYKLAGLTGTLVAIIGTIIPPFVIISLISAFYHAFRDNYLVSQMLEGMQAGVGAVIASVTYEMGCGIIKKKDNKPQSELNKLERIKNVEDIYEINKPIEVKNKKVLLLDDIYTTGSTVNEIARKLKQNQTQEIGVITLAKD